MKTGTFLFSQVKLFDPLGRPTVTAGRDHCFFTCRPSVPTFQNLAKQSKAKTMFATGNTVGPGRVDH